MKKIPVAIAGANGLVGKTYQKLLQNHPWFTLTQLGATKGNPEEGIVHFRELEAKVIFSALPASEAAVELEYAKKGMAVISHSSAHRRDPEVPLVIPEINGHHLDLIPTQRKRRNWTTGCLVAKPNCSIQSYLLPLAALRKVAEPTAIVVTNLQSMSGAGRAGLRDPDILANIFPYIEGEEEKSEEEPKRILEKEYPLSAHCCRVPVQEGHLSCVSINLDKQLSFAEFTAALTAFPSLPFPSAPKPPILLCEELNRPQPRFDCMRGGGMAVTVGRIRPCPTFQWRFVALSHNLVRGAAGTGLLTAEMLYSQGYIDG